MTNVLVTGVNGFVGKHLVRELRKQNAYIMGVGREKEAHPDIASSLAAYFSCDLTDLNAVKNLPLEKVDVIISLAGLAKPAESFKNPALYKDINVSVLSTILDQLLTIKGTARVIAISTGAVYDTNQPMPLTEESSLTETGSPYAQSKILMEEKAREAQSKGVDCVIVRPFNHIGPGQEPGLLVPDLYEQIVTASRSDKTLHVGNLKTKRDYTDVRDVVRAYTMLAFTKKLHHTVYNVCSGISIPGEVVLQTLLKTMGLVNQVTVEVDPERIRPTDLMDLYGSYERLTKDTGWQPQIPFEQTIQDFVASFK